MNAPGLQAALLEHNDVGQRLKIDIVVHGRFHGIALARTLIELGHDVIVHTNYPGFAVEKFGLDRSHCRSFVRHAVMTRLCNRIERYVSKEALDRFLHQDFGLWAAKGVRRDADVIYGFSGVMEEVLNLPRVRSEQLRLVVRGSCHIQEQDRILEEEEIRAESRLDRASRWMIDREKREYQLADRIVVLSTFARKSFVSYGLPEEKLWLLPLGVDAARFRPSQEAMNARLSRVCSGERLRVLNVGTFSFQKGVIDLTEIAKSLCDRFHFRFVGTRPAETANLMGKASNFIELIDRVPEDALRHYYAWADVFIYTTLQDGFAAVLMQAAASGLPILSTENCSAPDYVEVGRTGFIMPIRDTPSFITHLNWLDTNRNKLADMAIAASNANYARDWLEMGRDLIRLRTEALQASTVGLTK